MLVDFQETESMHLSALPLSVLKPVLLFVCLVSELGRLFFFPFFLSVLSDHLLSSGFIPAQFWFNQVISPGKGLRTQFMEKPRLGKLSNFKIMTF